LVEQTIAVTVVVNRDTARGQLSSVRRGLEEVVGMPAALLTLVDVPLVKRETIEALVQTWMQTHAPLVRPARAGRHGHPIVVSRGVIDALLAAPDAKTTREVLEPWLVQEIALEVSDEGPFVDVDTPGEYARLLQGWQP
jgi:molybdenum cofactor cytidylyltransferase